MRRADAYMNRQYLDPVFLGAYPDELREIFGEAWPEWSDDDMRLIKQPIDFLGINYYTRRVERASPPSTLPLRTKHVPQPQHIHTETDWEVFPEALTRVLLWVNERYGERSRSTSPRTAPPFYDPPHTIDGRVEDPLRVEYYRQHLRAAHEAMQEGREPSRLLRLVAARQLRVVARLLEALRHRPRRLLDPAANSIKILAEVRYYARSGSTIKERRRDSLAE